jgi:hypothetical protein
MISFLKAMIKNTMNKPHPGFRLFYIFLFTLALLQLACSSRPNIQGKGEDFMQGIWNEDSVAFSNKLSNYTQHHFKFCCDSVFIEMGTRS